MEAYPARTRDCRDPLHLGEVKDLAKNATHWGLDRDHPDRRRYATFLGPCDLGLHLGQRKSRLLGGERDQCQPAQLLRTIAGVVIDVAFALHDHPVATPCQEAQGKMVGERTAGRNTAISLPSSAAIRASSV